MIKLKFWDSLNKFWCDERDYLVNSNGVAMYFGSVEDDPVPEKWVKPIQFTGLTDKNGVELYEGDIVRILYTDWPSQSQQRDGSYSMDLDDYKDSISNIGKVVFKECEFCIQLNDDGYTSSIFAGAHGQITVIGNIYQNPELLEK